MLINIRTKGQNGEREIAKMLNSVVNNVRKERGLALYKSCDELFQRNQNQSAVGGDDLTNPLGLSIEVKRHETLSVPAWWRQTVQSANRVSGIPILLYRKNRCQWICYMFVNVPLHNLNSDGYTYTVPGSLSIHDFKIWFQYYYEDYLDNVNQSGGSNT